MGCQMKDSLVSVISCFYNRSEYVCRSVESLLSQTYKNIEILLVDDGSTDDTLDQLSSYKDSRIKLISHPNKGFVHALKDAISVSKGEIVAIHGSGDISLPERIEKQVNLLDKNSDVGVVGCYIKDFSLSKEQWTIVRKSIGENQLSQLIQHNIFSHGEVMFRRDCYEQVGGYRDFFEFAQDRDLWLRLATVTRFAIVQEVLYQREPINGSVTKVPSKAKMQACLSEFAIACAISRRDKGFDPLERHGNEAFERLAYASPKLSIRLRRLASRYVVDQQFDAARDLMSEAVDINPSRLNNLILVSIALAQKIPIFRLPLRLIFQWRLRLLSLTRLCSPNL